MSDNDSLEYKMASLHSVGSGSTWSVGGISLS